MSPTDFEDGRRRFLAQLIAAPFALGAAAKLGVFGEAAAAEALLLASTPSKTKKPLAATPECGDDDDFTPSETEGPFYSPGNPRRTSFLETGITGTKIVIAGRVFARSCRPVAGAMLDFWHCDDAGDYDNEGFKLRGHQFADAQGRWKLETIVPGTYPGRTRHIHVKVQPPAGRVLTTQLYFPGEGRNQRDGLFRRELLMAVDDAAPVKQGRFHFVLDLA